MIFWRRAIYAAALSTGALSACSDSGVEISENDAEFEWPFTVSSGRVECRNGGEVVFVAQGQTYSVNGTANSFAEQRGYSNIHPIWKSNPDIPGTRISIGPVIDIGLQLC